MANRQETTMTAMTPLSYARNLQRSHLAGIAAILALVVWSYGPDLARLVSRWWNESDYIYGFLVVPFSVYLLWLRRDMVSPDSVRGSWWGLAPLAICLSLRWFSAFASDPVFNPLSLVPCLFGLTLLFGGWRVLAWAWPAIAFLVFMIPLPSFVATAMGLTLQQIATTMSAYSLQTLGFSAITKGNVIFLPNSQLEVVHACSGLRMMMLFVAVCTGASFLIRSAVEKIVVLVSAVPIAVIANVIRITATGVLYEMVSHEAGETLYHDIAGFFMMILAVLLMWAEITLIGAIFQPHEDDSLAAAFAGPPRAMEGR